MDQLDWDKNKLLIQEMFRTSPVHVVVYILPVQKNEQKNIPVETEPTEELARAQEADELLKQVRRWVGQKTIPTQKSVQGPDGKFTINWLVYTYTIVFFVVNLSPRMVV